MASQELAHVKEIGATAACACCLVAAFKYAGAAEEEEWEDAQHHGKGETFVSDSWFSGVEAVKEVKKKGHNFIGIVKSNCKCFLKEELETMMANWLSGLWLLLKCVTPNSNQTALCALRYQYSQRKVLSFVFAQGAGTAVDGTPYGAKFTDTHGNVQAWHVAQPTVVGEFLDGSNGVDTHNHAWQFKLGLERMWRTHSCWFGIATTFIGMCVTNCWKVMQFLATHKAIKEMPISHFSDHLVFALFSVPAKQINPRAVFFPQKGDQAHPSVVASERYY
jgi:hypothetical protein